MIAKMTAKTNDVLVVECTGKRPGTKKERPTENFRIDYDHIIITNDCEGYETDWDIVKVPDEYRKYYEKNFRTSEGSLWLGPMNRSYAIKYAKEHGYQFLCMLDDNIKSLEIGYNIGDLWYRSAFRGSEGRQSPYADEMMDDTIYLLRMMLVHSNAGAAGTCMSYNPLVDRLFGEGYIYSIWMVDLQKTDMPVPGDAEEDVAYALKLEEMGIPEISIYIIRYAKISQGFNKPDEDKSGNRDDYIKLGAKRGTVLRKVSGHKFQAGLSIRSHGSNGKDYKTPVFRHKLKPLCAGIYTQNWDEVLDEVKKLLAKHAPPVRNEVVVKKINIGDKGGRDG